MKKPEELRQIAERRHDEIEARREKERAAQERATASRRKKYFKDRRQVWLNECESHIENAANQGRKKVDIRLEPGTSPVENKEFGHALAMEILEELKKQGFSVIWSTYHLPGDHEGPEIYTIVLTIDWSSRD